LASDLASLVPQTVSVAFRATGTGQPSNGFYNVDTNLFDIGLAAFRNTVGYPWTRLLHRYEIATYGASPPPTNQADLDALALQMATDWYQWQLGTLDRYFAGIAEWNPEGLHDITFEQRGGKITTHVQRMVFNPAEDLLYETNQITNNTPVIGIGDGSILYIDNGFISGDYTHLAWDETTFLFSVVGGAYFDIKNSKTFIIEETTTNNQYFKITNSTNQINIWENTVIINEGLVKIDISIVNQQFFVWDQTNYYIKIDDSTQLVTFWNAFITISSTVFKITNSGTDYFYVDNSDQSIKIGWPTKATSDTGKYAYWHYVAGKPTGAATAKTGYWAWLFDSTNYRSWFYAEAVSKWLLECCWIIVKKSSNYTAEYGDFIWGDTSGGGVDIDLPSPLLNQEIKIRTDTLTNPLRVTGTGIGTNVPLTLQNMTYDFYSDGTNWLTDAVEPAIPYGTTTGDMLVWNDSAQEWQILDAPTTDGYVLTSDSGETLKMKWAPSCCYEPYTETFDVDGTFTSTFDGYIEIEAYGAGGAGISTNTNGGGGGGAYAKKNSYAVTNGGTYTVVVATNSTEDSYFVSTAVIKAVSGATTATSSGGAGGAAASCVGDVTYSGGDGAAYSAPDGGGGGGCATSSANGGNASGATGGTGSFAGGTGGGDGFGGGGGGGSQAGGAGAGGSGLGGVGRVIVTRIS